MSETELAITFYHGERLVHRLKTTLRRIVVQLFTIAFWFLLAAVTLAQPDPEPPTVEALLEGYTLKPGMDHALYDKLRVISVEFVGDVLKVTGTYQEKALFGGQSNWSIYLPPSEKFQGRFYERIYPFDTKNLPDDLRFSQLSGAYQVEYYELFKINGAALTADISRTIAANYYGLDREGARTPGSKDYIYGYAYGGSGGSPAAIDALEDNQYNVWDGVIPYVITAPYTYPTGGDTLPVFRNLLLRGLGTQIWDAMQPGGIGRDAMLAKLTPLQRETVEELEYLGLPWREIGTVGASIRADGGPEIPREYVVDFWERRGYTGTQDSHIGEFFREIRGTTIDGTVMTDALLAKIAWHRHRNFAPALGLFMYDQFNDYAKSGPVETLPRYTGNIQRKGILIQNMQDAGAIYVSAEWYKRLVAKNRKTDDFRVYVQESAGHLDGPLSSGGDVPYLGILEQALRDLAAWVEKGREPAPSTGYDIVRNQIYLKPTMAERRGLQPMITLTADGAKGLDGKLVEVSAGDSVGFDAIVEPANRGDVITSIQWSCMTDGENFTDLPFTIASDGTTTVHAEATFPVVGTFFPRIRATVYRESAPIEGVVGRMMNQVSVRIVVKTARHPEEQITEPR